MDNEQADRKPEWAPAGSGSEFASRVMKGTDTGGVVIAPAQRKFQRTKRNAQYYIDGILNGNRTALAQAITLIESNLPEHTEISQTIVSSLLPKSGESIRIGVTGVPGAGKSTFIDSFGTFLCEEENEKVAVLAVDPSSTISGGSILGDKTRMERLSRLPGAFIRPSPTGGSLGGVTRKSRETIVLCEAAGYDVILVETVGVGQSETTVRSMVDFFLLLMIAGAGDELQGIKKGVIEIADALIVNKADGSNKSAARLAQKEYTQALRYLVAATPGWQTKAYTCSAITGEGIREFWQVVSEFRRQMEDNGYFAYRRQQQRVEWMLAMTEQHLRDQLYAAPGVKKSLTSLKEAVAEGKMSTSAAAGNLLELFYEHLQHTPEAE